MKSLSATPIPTRLRAVSKALLVFSIATTSLSAELLPLVNPSFENDGIGSGDFLNTSPAGWVRVVPSGCTVGVIGETRSLVRDTPAAIAWGHLQTSASSAQAPRIGQRIGALDDALFGSPSRPNLWVHCLASRRLNETTAIHLTASLYAVNAGAADWTGGTLVASAVYSANLANLTDGDPGSLADVSLMLALNNTAARAAHPGGDYWLLLANTAVNTSAQLHIDRVDAQTGDATDPGPDVPPQPPDPPIAAADQVDGDLILFNDNGGWCWYQDERIIVDRDTGDLVIASVANYLGYGGEPRDGDMDVTTFNPSTGKRTRVTLGTVPTLGKGDDHNVAALWQRPDGRYFAMHTGHNYGAGYNDTVDWGDDNVPRSFHRTTTLPNDGSAWGAEQVFTWPENGTFHDDVTYTNLHFLSAEGSGQGRLYNIARADDRTATIAYSDDQGVTWNYGGRLSSTTSTNTYSNGYFVFTSNGVDRIDFMATEHHPRDFNNSIYHGYIQGGKSYNSLGTVIDHNIFDQTAPAPQDFTRVWATSPVTSTSYHHAWTMEIEAIGGNIYGLITTRYGNVQSTERVGDSDHRLFYARFDGSTWATNELCKMGNSLDGQEGDYTGLGSIDPNDPSTIYISAEHDPRNASPLPKHEIFKGVTPDHGATWTWTPITENSTVENFRPIVSASNGTNTAVIWLRGRYPFQRDYDQSVVGTIRRTDEQADLVQYFDAAPDNTTLADGSPLAATGPAATDGPADGQWHRHTGFGNEATAYTTNEAGSENAPTIKTTVSGLTAGTYDVFAYFWSRPNDDWRIRAGFDPAELLAFRRYSSQQAELPQFNSPVIVLDSSRALYRAYVGRRTVSDGAALEVFVGDFDGASSAGTQRSAYDGIGVARVLPVLHVATGETFALPSGAGPYASIHNEGTLILGPDPLQVIADFTNTGLLILHGDGSLEVGGAFTNSGVIDLINWTGTLPPELVNTGTNIDRESIGTPTISLSGNDVEITVQAHIHHFYQLQYSPDLTPDSWQDTGPPASGTGTGGASLPIILTHPDALTASPRGFYRVRVDLAP